MKHQGIKILFLFLFFCAKISNVSAQETLLSLSIDNIPLYFNTYTNELTEEGKNRLEIWGWWLELYKEPNTYKKVSSVHCLDEKRKNKYIGLERAKSILDTLIAMCNINTYNLMIEDSKYMPALGEYCEDLPSALYYSGAVVNSNTSLFFNTTIPFSLKSSVIDTKTKAALDKLGVFFTSTSSQHKHGTTRIILKTTHSSEEKTKNKFINIHRSKEIIDYLVEKYNVPIWYFDIMYEENTISEEFPLGSVVCEVIY